MTGALTILRREVWRRRQLFGLAAALALLAVLMPLLPGLGSYAAGEVRGATSAAFALFVGLVTAVVMGGAIAGRDLSEGRFGFDFARPVSGRAIWAGRLTAAIVVVFGVELVTLVPALAGDLRTLLAPMVQEVVPVAGLLPDRGKIGFAIALYTILPLLTMLVVHVVGIAVRARTVWLVVDALGAVVAAAVLWFALRPFVTEVQIVPAVVVGSALTVAVTTGLLSASWAQVTRGRADLGRAHRGGALVGWPIVGSTLAIAIAYSTWLWNVHPGDLRGISVPQARTDGSWFVVEGEDPGRWGLRGRFAVHSLDGRWVRLDALSPMMYRTLYFLNQREGAVVRDVQGGREVLSLLDLSSAALGDERELISFPREEWFMVSPVGSVVVYSNGDTLLGIDADSGDHLEGTRTVPRQLARKVPDQWMWYRVTFVEPDVVRIATWGWRSETREKTVEVFDFDLRRGQQTTVAEMVVGDWTKLMLAERGTVLWLSWRDIDTDATKGFRLPDLEPVGGEPNPAYGLRHRTRMVDGHTVRIEPDDDQPVVTIESPADGSVRAVVFPRSRWVRLGPELRGGRLLLWGAVLDDGQRSHELAVLDVSTGDVDPISHDLRYVFAYDRRRSSWSPTDAVIFVTHDDAVVRWNADTGELTTVPGFEREGD